MTATHFRKCIIGELRQDNAQNSTEQVVGEEMKQDRDKMKPSIPCIHKDICPFFIEADLL